MYPWVVTEYEATVPMTTTPAHSIGPQTSGGKKASHYFILDWDIHNVCLFTTQSVLLVTINK